MQKINIIQFLPYFPPHKWWVETVWEEIWINWIKNNFWDFINVITDFEQGSKIEKGEIIIFENEIIWYKENNIIHLVIPSFEIINNFPIYKFGDKKTILIFKYLKLYLQQNKNIRVITHTRFFLPSLFWWIFAIKNKLKWIHIEHGSDYVKLWSKFKSKISYIYDRIIWAWIFKYSDKIIAISQACKNFVQNEFIYREVQVIYRWLEINLDDNKNIENLKEKFDWKIIIWFVWRILKWKNVDSLIKAYYLLPNNIKNKIQIVIVWNWEELKNLKNIDIENKIYFTWSKSFEEALLLQKQFYIHFHTSSPGWWLATTLLQAMQLWCFIIATPYEWALEVIKDWENGVLLSDDKIETFKNWIIKVLDNIDKKEDFAKVNKEIIKEKFNREQNILNLYNLIK